MVGLALLASLAIAQADTVRVSAVLTTDRIVPGESTILEIRVETNGAVPESIELPVMPAGIDILGTQDFSQTQTVFPGGRTHTTSRRIVLTGRVPGTFRIPAFDVVVGRRRYRTNPLNFLVLAAAPGTASASASERVRLSAIVQPDTVWVGQQVMLRTEAEFPREIRQRQTRPATYQAPNPAGFWAQDVTDPLVITLRNVGGEIYETQIFRRAYFPLLPGRHAFPPARLSYEFRPSLGAPAEAHDLSTDSIIVEVRPLPDAGRPASFTGAVGRFAIDARIEPERVAVGEAASLIVEVTGSGNMKALPGPILPDLPGLEVFPPTESAVQTTDSDTMGGSKTFTWVVVPQQPGEREIPPIAYGYFDPDAERYRVARAGPRRLEVTGVAAPANPAADLRPIHGRPGSDRLAFVRSPLFAALQAVPLLAMLLVGWGIRRADAPTPERKRTRILDERFDRLRKDAVAADREFWGRLAEGIRLSLVEITGRDRVRTAPASQVRLEIEAAGIPGATAAAIGELLDSLDRVRYAPGVVAPFDAPAIVERAERLVRASMSARPGRGRRANVNALLLLLPITLFATADPSFDRGVEAFRNAQYMQSAAAFTEYAEANPSDPQGWYDAGNAWYMAGRPGFAVRNWIRTARLQPRHRDARANILANAGVAARFIPPPFALNSLETRLGLSAVWWIASVLVVARLLRRRRLVRTAVTALALMATIGGAGLAGRIGAVPAAVSTSADAAVRADPNLKGEEIDRLPPGRTVEIVDRRDDWLHVRTPSGVEGWVEAAHLAEV